MGRPKHSRPATSKQITALKLINEVDPETNKPYSKRKAMLKAGYSVKAAENPKRLMESQAITTIVDQFKLELKDRGVTTAYLASKYAEWLDATNAIGRPDYHVQLEAGKLIKDVYDLKPPTQKTDDKGVTRRVTLEEFINTPT